MAVSASSLPPAHHVNLAWTLQATLAMAATTALHTAALPLTGETAVELARLEATSAAAAPVADDDDDNHDDGDDGYDDDDDEAAPDDTFFLRSLFLYGGEGGESGTP